MSSDYAPVHHKTTTDGRIESSNITNNLTSDNTTRSGGHGFTNSNSSSSFGRTDDQITSAANTTTTGATGSSAANSENTTGMSDRQFEQARRSSLANLEERRKSSLASTPGPFGAVTTDTATSSEVNPSSSVGTQNAPGLPGKIGEGAMGALGYGGSQVERPKQDQGLGEKIVNFLGA